MTLETENADSMSSSESTLRIWGQESAFEQTGWWGVGHSPPGQGSWASTCISLFCGFSTSLASSLTSSCVYRAQLIAGVRQFHPPWVESQAHHFLMCHQPQRAHSAARADPGAWSPAWSRPGQRRMTARCLQPARDLDVQRHQKPSGPLSGPFLSMRRRKLVFKKLISPETGQ